jgi:hypothetical protein
MTSGVARRVITLLPNPRGRIAVEYGVPVVSEVELDRVNG